MSWGKDLWDQFDNVAIQTQKGIDFLEKFAHFIKERCIIENEYAAKIKKLTKNYQPKKKDEDNDWSYAKGFCGMITEVHDIAGQHEVIADNLTNVILKDLLVLIQQIKQDRKKFLQSGNKQCNNLQSQIQILDKAKRLYDKAFKEAEKAQEIYKKADADIHMSRADVEKAKNLMVQKQQSCEESKNEYASELQKTNECQRQHFSTLMPLIFEQLQEMEERRINKVQELLKSCSDTEKNIMPIINTCIAGMVKSADDVSAPQDLQGVVDKYKSGFLPPDDIPFEDLSNQGNGGENHTPATNSVSSLRTESVRSSLSGSMRTKKRTRILNIFSGSKSDDSKEDFSHLPPNQQKKKLTQRIVALKSSLAKETAERDGMLKMQDVYRQNQALGDPQTLSKQLEENAQKLDKLRLELQKFEQYLADVDKVNVQDSRSNRSSSSFQGSVGSGSLPTTPVNTHQHGLHHADSVSTTKSHDNSHGRSDKRVSGHSGGDQDSFDDIDDDDEPITPISPIGTCTALYAFQAPSEGSISMEEGEEFIIVEQDQGDGWMRVRRSNGEEGFVPTSYVECHITNGS